MKTLCQPATICPCDNLPGTDYDATAPETDEFVATGFAAMVPPLGTPTWQRLSCMMFAESETSQSAAQFNADQQALLCVLNSVSPYSPETGPGGGGSGGGGGGGLQPLVFFNGPASCTVNCPDGLPFTFQVPAGRFPASSQAAADAAANTYACQQAAMRALCLSALTPGTYTLNSPYSGTITATGGGLATGGQTNQWTLASGSLPTGLTFNGGALPSNQVTITGTPTAPGVFTFAVQCTDPLGDTMTKTYSLSCGTGYTMVTNAYPFVATPTDVGFITAAPDGIYDTAWQNKNVAPQTNGGNYMKLNFISPTLKTWNVKCVLTSSNGSGFQYLKFNGAAQVFVVSGGGTIFTFTGSFNTDTCTALVVEIDSGPANGGAMTAFLEWQTPA